MGVLGEEEEKVTVGKERIRCRRETEEKDEIKRGIVSRGEMNVCKIKKFQTGGCNFQFFRL